MSLTVEQRLDWLEVRIDELRPWQLRAWTDLDEWTWDGEPLALGARWPQRIGLRTLEHPTVSAPAGWAPGECRLVLDLGGEGLVALSYADGVKQSFGLDVNHRSFPLRDEPFATAVTIVARSPFGVPNRDARLGVARLAWVEVGLKRFVRRLELVLESGRVLGSHDAVEPLVTAAERAIARLEWPSATLPYVARRATSAEMLEIWELPAGLEPHPEGLDDGARASVAAAAARLHEDLVALRGRHPPLGALRLTGHAHLDLAWLWPLAETRRKAQRTFANALALLERYPELTFNQSSAQLYAFVEEDAPELFERVTAAAAGGRWEPIGGMWVEPDLNMPAGESLVRQLLYGQRFFLGRFGAAHSVCWLPDCFGFTPALPQLLRGAGIEHFLTIKLNWSETNAFPHDLFWWEGLDGSRVFAHLFDNPDGEYNGQLGPRSAVGTWKAFRGKALHGESLLSVGHGDGGGGITEDMAERGRELAAFPALPEQRFGRVDDFFAETRAAVGERAPTWTGELYVELHRGTLTTQGRTKRLHRRAERELVAAEVIGALARLLDGPEPPSLEPLWRMLLRNQFHDILPGSGIREVYEEAERELTSVIAQAGELIDERLKELAERLVEPGDRPALLLVNPGLQPRPVRVELAAPFPGAQEVEGGSAVSAATAIPGLGLEALVEAAPAGELSVSERCLENALLLVRLASDGTLESVWDKRARREVLDGRGNQLWAYVDKPRAWDAWDVEASYPADGEELPAPESVRVVERGPHRAAVRLERRFRNSTVTQDVRLWAGSARLEFRTRLDWHDRRWLLKARFPLAVRSPRASFETAFGIVERPTHRNTSWDAARFEVAGHRFADLSEPGYGVALLNDGRYGHHALGSELGLSLLRSPAWPDPLADEGTQDVTYALLPHSGGLVEGGVLMEAEDLNRPLLALPVRAGAHGSWRPLLVSGLPLGLGTLKPLEDGGGLLLRAYEPAGARGAVTIELPAQWTLAAEVDLLEGGAHAPSLVFRPFQVRSWRLERRR